MSGANEDGADTYVWPPITRAHEVALVSGNYVDTTVETMFTHDMTTMAKPEVNVPIDTPRGVTILPTYVRLSEAPKPDGSCVTGEGINAAGWYVEFFYAGGPYGGLSTVQYRQFFPFGAFD